MEGHHTISPEEIQHAAWLLRAGKLVAFPTETVYGLGANALDRDSGGPDFRSQRQTDKPAPLLCT